MGAGAPTGEVMIAAQDGYALGGEVFHPDSGASRRVVMVNPAMGVPARFYRKFAAGLAEAGYSVVLWDYRGIGASRNGSLRGFPATMEHWVFFDMSAVIDWIKGALRPERVFLVGHSLGGQVAGLLPYPGLIHAMVTLSAQSAYWKLQGGLQKQAVLFHGWVSIPWITRLVGYAPWKRLGLGEDLPREVALRWASWIRHPDYLFGDASLPLERYAKFTAPVLAYSVDDDDWGTARAVDTLMRRYPDVERRHVVPAEHGLDAVGHVGFFRPESRPLWDDAIAWLDER